MGGFSLGCAEIECLARSLAGEIGRQGVRVACIRPSFTRETYPDVPLDAIQPLIDRTALGRLPLLREVADTAAFVASDGAGAISGAVINLTCGGIVD